ncbi:Alpha galactosidase A [Sphingomonas guangdongensis]|uniref:Alpha-galactosidase n=1 Tax=Sphingomonas guangdongensis TaxID=1141890 RepID=A0A285QXW9_9SPHN|nr:NPCBM/NEW2 domain-containing protein [Sphingomonas guangdongensis]SOB86404.1 Alpha galactosidase A [Sphingomonas guangdongensis]
MRHDRPSRWWRSALLAAAALGLQAPGAAQNAARPAASADPLAPTARWSAYTRGRAALPPMGWNSWNAFNTDIDEAKIIGSAERMVASGLAAKGYRYLNLDDGWWLKRRLGDGRILVRPDRFPSAATAPGGNSFRPLTDRLHAMGLKAGIYSDLGRNICSQAYATDRVNLPQGSVQEREVGLYGHIDRDIDLFFRDWGFDYIKIDGCGIRAFGADAERVRSGEFRALAPTVDLKEVMRTDIAAVRTMFDQVNQALTRSNPDGDWILSLCLWGSANVRAWGKDLGNVSRTSDDLTPSWGRMLANFDSAAKRALYAHPGSWNDPDMLYIGAGDFDAAHLEQARSHFALWAIINAPLLMGTDLRSAPPALMELFGNERIIALNQDPAGHQAVIAFDSDDLQIFVKTLASGEKGVAVFNRGAEAIDVNFAAGLLRFADDAPVTLTDLWSGRATSFTRETKLHVEPRQTLILRAKGTRTLADGLYLSEQPGNVNPAVDGVTVPQHDPTIYRSLGWAGTRGAGDRPIYAGWGGAQADSTPYGQLLQIAGRPLGGGIGILANSRLEVRNQGYRRFTATVGVDDSARDKARAVTFQVYADGRLIGSSPALRHGQTGHAFDLSVAGARIVELVARTTSGSTDTLPVTWGDAALRR